MFLYTQCIKEYKKIIKLFVFYFWTGGEDRTISYSAVERFDPKTNTWSEAPNMKAKRAGAGVTVCDGKIYVAGLCLCYNLTLYPVCGC